MNTSGESMLPLDEAAAFAELAKEFDPDATLVVSGLTAVMARVQQEAGQDAELQAAGAPVATEATMFQSSY